MGEESPAGKKVPCCGPWPCRNRSVRTPDGDEDLVGVKEMVAVPAGFEGPAYCSVECLLYGRAAKTESGNEDAPG